MTDHAERRRRADVPDLRINRTFVRRWSELYTSSQSPTERDAEATLFDQIGPAVRSRGFYARDEFLAVVRWKNSRGTGYASRNDADAIEEITRTALSAPQRFQLRYLDLLEGVGVPVASALLTVWDPDGYTVVDWRAVEVLRAGGALPAGPGVPDYWDYLSVCVTIARRLDVSLRQLDRSLWKYSQQELSPRR